jgi:hypothetical protein
MPLVKTRNWGEKVRPHERTVRLFDSIAEEEFFLPRENFQALRIMRVSQTSKDNIERG